MCSAESSLTICASRSSSSARLGHALGQAAGTSRASPASRRRACFAVVEVVALQPPRLGEHLPPLLARVEKWKRPAREVDLRLGELLVRQQVVPGRRLGGVDDVEVVPLAHAAASCRPATARSPRRRLRIGFGSAFSGSKVTVSSAIESLSTPGWTVSQNSALLARPSATRSCRPARAPRGGAARCRRGRSPPSAALSPFSLLLGFVRSLLGSLASFSRPPPPRPPPCPWVSRGAARRAAGTGSAAPSLSAMPIDPRGRRQRTAPAGAGPRGRRRAVAGCGRRGSRATCRRGSTPGCRCRSGRW